MGHTQTEFRSSGIIIKQEAVTRANTTLNQFDCLITNDGGNIALKCPGCTTVTVNKNKNAGELLPINTDYIMTTSTTSTDILGCTLGRIPVE